MHYTFILESIEQGVRDEMSISVIGQLKAQIYKYTDI